MEVACNASHEEPLQRIVAQIEAGDRSAETELVNRFQRGITLLARRHSRPNESRVADVVQNVLMATIERLRMGALRDADALPGYLRTAVIHEVTALYRDKNARSSVSMTDGQVAELATSETPESRAAQAQLLGKTLRAMESLSVPRDRELLIRFYVHEESRDEICMALGIDEGHFRRVLFRARERLQALLESAA